MTLNELWAQIPKQYRDLPLELYIGIDTLMVHGPSPITVGNWQYDEPPIEPDDDLDSTFNCEYPRIILLVKK